jgi:hypothetical protein
VADEVSYCRRWNFYEHAPIEPLTPAQAAKRDAAGKFYTAVLCAPGEARPHTVLEVCWSTDSASVWFCDEHGRQTLNYAFRRNPDDRLFLYNIGEWAYPDDAAESLAGAVRVESISFGEDGTVKRVVDDYEREERETVDISDVDVSPHWEPVPQFGSWTSLARWDRG